MTSTAIGYVRISRPEGSPRELATARQEIEAEARRRGWMLADVHEDVGAIGWVPPERPAFEHALASLDRGDAEVLVVRSLHELTRSIEEARALVARAREHGWTVCSVNGRATSRPAGDSVLDELDQVLVP